MCLLALQNLATNEPLTREMFDRAWTQNPHGGGVGYWRNIEPVILTTMEKDVGWNMYLHAVEEVKKNADLKPSRPQNLMIHWRWSTHGAKQRSNNHPFFVPVDNGVILGHNGTTQHNGIDRPYEWSDTRTFAELWIPQKAPKILSDADQVKEIMEQIGGSRLALMTPWSRRFFNFPDQKEEYKKYGEFSNFLFDPVYKPRVENQPNRHWQGSTHIYKPSFKEWPNTNEDDKARWATPDRPGQGRTFKFMSANMVHRCMSYCIKTNMSFAGAITMFMKLFEDFPTHKQVEDFYEVFGEFLDAASAEMGDVPLTDPLQATMHEHPETAEQMMTHWMEFNGFPKPKDEGAPKLSKKEKEALQKALKEEQEIADKKIDEFVKGSIELQKQEENWRIEDDFRDEGPKNEHEKPVIGFGHGDEIINAPHRAFED